MFNYFSSSMIRLSVVLLAAMLLAAAGCNSDILTYANDSQRQGIQNMNDGKYVDAAADFRNAIRQVPNNPESFYLLGQCNEKLGQWHDAIDVYKTGIKVMPKSGYYPQDPTLKEKMIDRLANVIATDDPNHQETDALVKEAQRTNSVDDYRMLGRMFRYHGDADSAIDAYTHAAKLDADDFAVRKEFGLYLLTLNMNQQAADTLRDAYRLNQNDEEGNQALTKLGVVPGPALLPQNTLK